MMIYLLLTKKEYQSSMSKQSGRWWIMKERIKTVLDIEDSRQDDVLDILISNVSSHLKAKLGKDIPKSLEFIVEEITIRRFNRIGTEGMQSESVEGHSITFYDLEKEFVPYDDIIDDNKDRGDGKRGKVMFI